MKPWSGKRPPDDYYESPGWIERRNAFIARRKAAKDFHCYIGNECALIGEFRREVHHLHYHSLGVEKDEDLEVLCRAHHTGFHIWSKDNQAGIDRHSLDRFKLVCDQHWLAELVRAYPELR